MSEIRPKSSKTSEHAQCGEVLLQALGIGALHTDGLPGVLRHTGAPVVTEVSKAWVGLCAAWGTGPVSEHQKDCRLTAAPPSGTRV